MSKEKIYIKFEKNENDIEYLLLIKTHKLKNSYDIKKIKFWLDYEGCWSDNVGNIKSYIEGYTEFK